MKAFISVVIGFLMMVISTSAQANDFALALGIRSNSADSDNTGYSASTKTGVGIGAIGFFDIGQAFQLRSGFLYNQRNYTLTASGANDVELNMAYVDIPVTAMYKFADYAGVFAGPVLGFLASKECKPGSACDTNKVDGTMLGLQFGASFKFAPQMGGEIYYEMIPTTFWKDQLKNARTVGFNLLVTFE